MAEMNGGDADMLAYIQTMTPEELDRLLGLGSFGQREQLLEEEAARAQAMQQPRGTRYSTGGGALLGAVGDVAGALGGSMYADLIRGKRSQLLDETDQRRRLLAEAAKRVAARDDFAKQMKGAGAGDMVPGPFRLG
jgi:hypothetical protein